MGLCAGDWSLPQPQTVIFFMPKSFIPLMILNVNIKLGFIWGGGVEIDIQLP